MDKINTGYLYAKDDKRIFVNTCLGCNSECSYCYLNQYGYKDGKLKVKKAEEIIEELDRLNVDKNTLITMGCFSECFDEVNKPETLKILKYMLEKGNQVQVATKRQIKYEDIKDVLDLISYPGQLVLFISSASISNWSKLEKGTDPIEDRFKSFENLKETEIPMVLYMKPVIKDVTKNDIELYSGIIKKYGINDVVVGSIFGRKHIGEPVHFADDGELFYNPIDDELEIKQKLGFENPGVRIFSRSSQVMSFYKDRTKEREEL